MSGRTRGVSPRSAGRRRRSFAILASAMLHVALLGWFALKRAAEAPQAATPAVNVQLVRLPPIPKPVTDATPKRLPARATPRPTDSAVAPRLATPTPASGTGAADGVDPRWAVDLNKPVFADGKWPRPPRPLLAKCDPLKDPNRESKACRREDDVARAVTRSYDPQQGTGELAREGRRKEAVKRYHELPGTAGYPGIGCQIFGRC